ncbi:MAG: hypothetical protein SF187_04040 [Deltaproteobacteria bacterium]|nr:hypothetical protein [Deltaproteobacteria bacterium]
MKKASLLFCALAAFGSACEDGDAPSFDTNPDAAQMDASIAFGDASADAISADVRNDAAGPLGSTQPLSLVLLTHEFGFLNESFRLPDVPDGQQMSLPAVGVLGSAVLEPFSALRQQLVAVAGAGYHVSWNQNVYEPMMLLTGHPYWRSPSARPGDPPRALGPSIDWLVGHHLRLDASPGAREVMVIGRPSFTFDASGNNVLAMNSFTDAAKAIVAETNCNIDVRPQASLTDGLAVWMDRAIPLLTSALLCDGPRVFALNLARPSSQDFSFPGNLAQDAAHRIGVPGEDGRNARAVMQRYNAFVATQVARLGEALSTHQGRDGAPLLENTLVVWVGREGQPDHNPFPWHAIMLGGHKLGLATGRYIALPQDTAFNTGTDVINTGPPHNKLLTSVARLFGVDVDSIGAKSFVTKNGGTLDLTGHLPQLDRQ